MSEQNESFGNMFSEFEACFSKVIKAQAMIEPMEYLHENTIALAQEYRKLKAAYIDAVASIPVSYATELPAFKGDGVVFWQHINLQFFQQDLAEYHIKSRFAESQKLPGQYRYIVFVVIPEESGRKGFFTLCTLGFKDICAYHNFTQILKPFLKDKDFFLQQNP